jgi:hypothetical protein
MRGEWFDLDQLATGYGISRGRKAARFRRSRKLDVDQIRLVPPY